MDIIGYQYKFILLERKCYWNAFRCFCFTRLSNPVALTAWSGWGNSIMLASPSVKRAVQARARLDPFVFNRMVEIYQHVQLLPISADDWFNNGSPCVIMSM